MIVAKYKFNPSTYADLLPEFNSGGNYTYTKSDVTNSDGTITRTIESDTLPSYVVFGNMGGGGATDKTKALLEVISLDLSNVSNCFILFLSCTNLKSALGIKLTSKTTNMTSMFNGCSSLVQLDVSNWNTSNVTNMNTMFQNCSSLTTLDLNNWDTSKVTNMASLFLGCKALTSLDVSNWDTSNVTGMGYMFLGCTSLTTLDLSNFNTSNVTSIQDIFRGCTSLRKVALKYSNQSTVSKIHENLPDRTSTTEGYILSLVDLTSDKNWEALKFNHNEFYLPQPLRKVGDVKDRLYWDYDKGHYCIEQNIGTFNLDDIILKRVFSDDGTIPNHKVIFIERPTLNIDCSSHFTTTPFMSDRCVIVNYPTSSLKHEMIFMRGSNDVRLGIRKDIYDRIGEEEVKNMFIGGKYYYPKDNPKIIDLPHLNKKYSLDTYMPTTYVDVTNLPLQPYGLLLKDDTARYKATLEPSTLYTIQFNCLSKSTTLLTLDLGGTRKTVDPIIGINHVQITTPSELTSDRLFLIGTGIIINEVIVNKGDMNQYTKYFDGEQSVGELQEDGSYIIRISTDNYTNLWEGDLE